MQSYRGKSISCYTILANIARTFKPPDSSWIQDAIEDIGWGITAIGYHIGYVHKATEPPYITVSNFRGEIPCDIERILHVEGLQVDEDSQNLLNPDGTTPYPLFSASEECPPKYRGTKLLLTGDTSGISVSKDSPRTTEMDTSNMWNVYQINGEYIITGFETGLIKIHYIGLPLDAEGYPLIVSEPNYIRALEWNCIERMMHRGFVPASKVSWADAHNLWEDYRYKAENAGKMMSLDAAESFNTSWNRYKSAGFASHFYAGLQQQEYIDR